MAKGYLAIILHAHLPYVRHPEHSDFLEERWFFEAITETYVPLLHAFQNLLRDGIQFRITLSLSPTLVAMMRDPLLCERYAHHLDKSIELAYRELDRTRHQPEFHRSALMYRDVLERTRETWRRYQGNLVRGFREVHDTGNLELMTCTATHMFFPLGDRNWAAYRAQVRVAADHHEAHVGVRPRGMWMGECGYVRGVDELMREAGIRFTILDTHALLFADRKPVYGVYAPVYCPSGVAAFGRDPESSKQVWSANEGYPGDPIYRDFYRDVGFDLPHDYIGPYIHPDGIRIHTGIKYYRITHRQMDGKQPYDPAAAVARTAEHAGNFLFNRERQIEYLAGRMDRPPLIVSPYDAELFGHWWYEGPHFLEYLFRKMQHDQAAVEPVTPSGYLARHPTNQVTTPCTSSWGYKGYGEFWLDGGNHWVYRHLHKAAERMAEMARTNPDAQGLRRRALNQAARELMLAQASDWAFILKTGTAVDYAIRRHGDHITRFNTIYDGLKKGELSEAWLSDVESKDNVFPYVDYQVYAT